MTHFKLCVGDSCTCDEEKRYWWVFAIGLGIALLEFVGGWASSSLALTSDAFHVLTDVAAGAISILVARAVRRNIRSERKLRAIGGFSSGALLAVAALWVLFQGVERLLLSREVAVFTMIGVAVAGTFGNYVQRWILKGAGAGHVTHQAAAKHVLSDLWQSIGVVLAGLAIWATDRNFFDPVISLAVGAVMAFWAYVIARESLALVRKS